LIPVDGYEFIRYEDVAEHVVRIVLDRPEVANALNLGVFRELDDALDRIERDSDVRVWMLTGAPPISRSRKTAAPATLPRSTRLRSSTASTTC
jgi:1,4-dihydroxy-2-naphthoyl-CoA synthase